MPVSEEALSSELRTLLDTVDLATTSESQVRSLLKDKLGAEVQEHKALIQKGVHDFLVEQKQKHLKAAASGKRKAEDPAGGAAKTQKNEDAEAPQLPIQLSKSRRADVQLYNGSIFANIREYYEKDGKQLPGKKGISLSTDQFKALQDAADAITAALDAKDEDFVLELSVKRKVTINIFKGKPMVDIREFYEKDNKPLPGKKGISLAEEQWAALAEGLPALQAGLEEASIDSKD